jgi:hypothetical protein
VPHDQHPSDRPGAPWPGPDSDASWTALDRCLVNLTPDQTDPATVLGTREHAERLTQNRHSGVHDALQWLAYSHLPAELQRYSAPFYTAACDLLTEIGTDSPELTTSLNKLVEAKDSGMRAGIKDKHGRAGSVPRPQTVVDPPTFGNFGPGQPQARTDKPQFSGRPHPHQIEGGDRG